MVVVSGPQYRTYVTYWTYLAPTTDDNLKSEILKLK
jgi:hypothetical protein